MSLPMQKSKYNAKAVAASLGKTNEGKPQIGITCEVIDHPDHVGETITWFGYFTEKTEDRTIESLQHFGWTGDDLSELADLDAEACARLLPTPVSLVCEPDEYDGRVKLKVQWVNKLGGAFAFKAPLEGADLKTFAAQMRRKIRGAQQAGGARPSQPATRSASNGSPGRPATQARHPNAPDDDIPF